ncbi:MAG: Hsp70 family protein, partial [Clostridia bacterium]|nr:Hsp70 family protein [Clostridia bacterium]
HVSAKDLGTQKEQSITITASSNLTEDEINKAVAEAEANAAEDKKRREEVETRNNFENTIYQLEKMLKDNGDKLPDEDKTKLSEAIEKAKKDKDSTDIEVIKKSMEELTNVSNEIFTRMYQNANPNGANGTDGTTGGENGSNNGTDGSDPEVVVD